MRLKHSLILAFLLIGNAAFGQHIELPKNFKKTEDATKMVFTWQKRDNEDDYEIEIWLDLDNNTELFLTQFSNKLQVGEFYKANKENYKYKAVKARYFAKNKKKYSKFTYIYPTAAPLDSLILDCVNLKITKATQLKSGEYEAIFKALVSKEKGCFTEGGQKIRIRLFFSADSFFNSAEDVELNKGDFLPREGNKIRGETDRKATTDKGYLFLQVVDKGGYQVTVSEPIKIE